MTKRNPFAKDLPEMAHGLREQAASEPDGSARPIPPDTLNWLTAAHWATVERETYYDAADETRDRLLAAYESVFDLRRQVEAHRATIAERDATIERLWAQLNEATNVPDHNDPEFGFDKTAALSEPDEEPS